MIKKINVLLILAMSLTVHDSAAVWPFDAFSFTAIMQWMRDHKAVAFTGITATITAAIATGYYFKFYKNEEQIQAKLNDNNNDDEKKTDKGKEEAEASAHLIIDINSINKTIAISILSVVNPSHTNDSQNQPLNMINTLLEPIINTQDQGSAVKIIKEWQKNIQKNKNQEAIDKLKRSLLEFDVDSDARIDIDSALNAEPKSLLLQHYVLLALAGLNNELPVINAKAQESQHPDNQEVEKLLEDQNLDPDIQTMSVHSLLEKDSAPLPPHDYHDETIAASLQIDKPRSKYGVSSSSTSPYNPEYDEASLKLAQKLEEEEKAKFQPEQDTYRDEELAKRLESEEAEDVSHYEQDASFPSVSSYSQTFSKIEQYVHQISQSSDQAKRENAQHILLLANSHNTSAADNDKISETVATLLTPLTNKNSDSQATIIGQYQTNISKNKESINDRINALKNLDLSFDITQILSFEPKALLEQPEAILTLAALNNEVEQRKQLQPSSRSSHAISSKKANTPFPTPQDGTKRTITDGGILPRKTSSHMSLTNQQKETLRQKRLARFSSQSGQSHL